MKHSTFLDIMNRDAERIKQSLSDVIGVETLQLKGPVISMNKLQKGNMVDTYALVVDALKQELKDIANGRPFRIIGIKVVSLLDPDCSIWEDYARHVLEVEFYDLRCAEQS